MQGDPQSQRPVCNTLQARKARPSSLEGEPEDGAPATSQGDPQSQRRFCNTLQAHNACPSSLNSREDLKTVCSPSRGHTVGSRLGIPISHNNIQIGVRNLDATLIETTLHSLEELAFDCPALFGHNRQ